MSSLLIYYKIFALILLFGFLYLSLLPLNKNYFIMGNLKFSIECSKVDNPIDRVIVNKCYNCNLSVGDYYYHVNIYSDVSSSLKTCFTFLTIEDAIYFVRKKFDL